MTAFLVNDGVNRGIVVADSAHEAAVMTQVFFGLPGPSEWDGEADMLNGPMDRRFWLISVRRESQVCARHLQLCRDGFRISGRRKNHVG